MRTRFDARAVIAPLAFAFFAVVLSMFAWLNFDGSLPMQAQKYRVGFVVPQAGNLQVGASVRSAGVEIGRVVDVERVRPRGARITAELEGSVVPLRADARVAVRAKSLLGEPYLQVHLGTRNAPAVPEDGELPITAAVGTQQLDDVLSTFDPATRAGVRRLVEGVSKAVAGRGTDISGALGQARPAATGTADLAEIVDRQRGSLRRLIRSGGAVLDEAGAREGAIQGMVTEGDRLFAVTGRRTEQITRIVRALPGFLGEMRGAGDVIAEATPDLRSAVRSLRPVAPRLDPALRALQDMLPEARGLFADLPATLASGRRGLPPGRRLLENLRPALDGLYPALREILPAVQFVAEDPGFVTSTAANLANIGNPYVPGPGGTKQRYARAVPMIWNEIPAGFQQPLPTSRQNQYPKPGSLDAVGKEPLKAWSCDHLDNPQTVPVIPPGTGAPPCLTQGPYEYRGKTAYYPRLERADP